MEFDSPLSMIGLIATVLAFTFALAAFLNSRRRQARQASAQTPASAAQTSNAPPLPSVRDVVQQRLAATQPRPEPGARTGADKPSPSIFKQVGPHGVEMPAGAPFADDEYIWE